MPRALARGKRHPREVLEAQFTDLLRQIVLDEEVVTWAAEALRHQDQQDDQRRQEAVERLRAEYDRLQHRLDAMYLDKLDGRISNSFFDEKAEAWRTEQRQILQAMEAHRGASRLYVDEGLYSIVVFWSVVGEPSCGHDSPLLGE